MLVKGFHCSCHPIFIFHSISHLKSTLLDLQKAKKKNLLILFINLIEHCYAKDKKNILILSINLLGHLLCQRQEIRQNMSFKLKILKVITHMNPYLHYVNPHLQDVELRLKSLYVWLFLIVFGKILFFPCELTSIMFARTWRIRLHNFH